jgi:hypothetical protein
MPTLITMQDGTEMALHEHLRNDHQKGTRGYTDAFLGRMHAQLHDHKHEAAHTHAETAPVDQLIPRQREGEPAQQR